MRANELFKPTKKGFFVGVRFDEDTQKNLSSWINGLNIDHPTPKEDFHCTLILSKDSVFPWEDEYYMPMIEVDPSTYKLELFGEDENILVLSFDCPPLEEKHMEARKKYKLDWDFNEYKPHFTVSDEGENNLRGMKVPEFPLYIFHEYSEPYGEEI